MNLFHSKSSFKLFLGRIDLDDDTIFVYQENGACFFSQSISISHRMIFLHREQVRPVRTVFLNECSPLRIVSEFPCDFHDREILVPVLVVYFPDGVACCNAGVAPGRPEFKNSIFPLNQLRQGTGNPLSGRVKSMKCTPSWTLVAAMIPLIS